MLLEALCQVIERTIKSITLKISIKANKRKFRACGTNVVFNPVNSDFIYQNISIGNDVLIGENASFIASIAHINIGNKVLFGPHVTIRGGNHRFNLPGKYIKDITDSEKFPTDDEDVIIEDDVWIGTNVTILKGVHVGRGAIVAAGAVVIHNIPPYTIAGGIPAKVIGKRFSSIDDVIKHEKKLFKHNPIEISYIKKYYD